jgi:TldD protein
MTTRRDFLRKSATAAAALAASRVVLPEEAFAFAAAQRGAETVAFIPDDAQIRELLMAALEASRSAGASYADARVGRQRQNFVTTREQQIINVVDTDSIGIGVRVLADGQWGFAATRTLTRDGVAAAAREAVSIARANRIPGVAPVEFAPGETHRDATWASPHARDPFDVAIEEKVDLLLKANAEAGKVQGVRFVNSSMFFVKENKYYANTDGSTINQTIIRSWLPFTVTAVAPDFSDFQSRGNVVQPAQGGYEYILAQDIVGNAKQWGEQAVEKLKAKPIEVGRYDLVLHPSHLWLTIHESIGHPTELDRAMGYEANYAGTSFIAPPEAQLGKLRYGPEFMNVLGDRSQTGGCSTVGYDDDGIKPEDFLIVKNGIFNDYQTTREQAPWLAWWYQQQGRPVRSHGCSYADSWANVAFQRMPNVSLLPGERDLVWDDVIADTDRGIAIVGDGSFSIDQQRYNAQFGGQLFYEIRGGKITGMLKDVAYQMRTPDFWNAMDMIGGQRSYEPGASFFDGKGQPSQINAVSHFCVPARFRQQNVINTGRTS